MFGIEIFDLIDALSVCQTSPLITTRKHTIDTRYRKRPSPKKVRLKSVLEDPGTVRGANIAMGDNKAETSFLAC